MGDYKANKKGEKAKTIKNAKELQKDVTSLAFESVGVPKPIAGAAAKAYNHSPSQKRGAKRLSNLASKNPLLKEGMNQVAENDNLKNGLKGLAGSKMGTPSNSIPGKQSPFGTTKGANRTTPNGPQFGKNLMDDDDFIDGEDQEQSGLDLLGGFAKGHSKKGAGTAKEVTAKGTATIKIKIYLIIAAVGVGLLLLLLLIALITNIFGMFAPAIGLDHELGNDLGGQGGAVSEEHQEYIDNLVAIQKKYKDEEDKEISAQAINATLVILQNYDSSISYDDMSKNEMKRIANIMVNAKEELESDSNDEEKVQSKTKEKLAKYFEEKIPGKDAKTYLRMADEVYEYLENYEELINSNDNKLLNSAAGSMCTYDVHGKSYSNLKVRLMQAGKVGNYTCGGTYGEPMVGEELVDFEKYVLGVGYAEHGGAPQEAFKAQLIFARTYALNRPKAVNNSAGRKFVEENGQSILQLTNCVSDQVYCDPDKGCSKDVAANNQYGMVYSGTTHQNIYKNAMPEDDERRTWANEVSGKVVVGEDGNITNSSYVSGTQKQMDELANQGYDYVDIIVKIQGKGVQIKNSVCTSPSSIEGSTEWKQYDKTWGSIRLGNSSQTIKSAGCLVTSISMLIAKSGALEMSPPPTITANNFNPGTFVKALNENNGFDNGGNFYWNTVTKVVPAFKYVGKTSLSGKTKNEKLTTITSKLNEGQYCAAEVKGSTGQHWVAIDRVEDSKVYMHDPASTSTEMWKQYNYNNTSAIACFTTK